MGIDDGAFSFGMIRGWEVYGFLGAGTTTIWATNDQVDTGFHEFTMPGRLLYDLVVCGYVPTPYHDGGDEPPILLFHGQSLEDPIYVWSPACSFFGTLGEVHRA